MSKTALDLTPQEWQSYNPAQNLHPDKYNERAQKAWELAHTFAHILREQFGAKRVVVFGSLLHTDGFDSLSDIDLAVWGILAKDFWQAGVTITCMSQEFQVDLVDIEDCRPRLRQLIEQEGIEI